MGYNIFSFGIKAIEVKAVFKSKNKALLTKVKEGSAFGSYSKSNNLNPKSSIENALDDIFEGRKLNNSSNNAYGYALICICETMGSKLPYQQEINLFHETDLINRYLNDDFDLQGEIEEILLIDYNNTFEIPKIKDWPQIGLLTNFQLVEIKKQIVNINISDEEIIRLHESEEESDEERGIAYLHLKGIIENMDYCIENGLDLVSFAH